MNCDAIGAIAEVIGAIAVVGSLVYLARQIGQNTKSLSKQAFQLSTTNVLEWSGRMSGSADLAELFLKGRKQFLSLTPVELERFTWHVVGLMVVYHQYYEYVKDDLMTKEAFTVMKRVIESYVSEGWFEPSWREHGAPKFSSDFQELIDGFVQGAA